MAKKWTRFTLPDADWWRKGGKKSVKKDLKPYKKMYPTKKYKVKAVQGPLREGQSAFGRPYRIFWRKK